MFPCFVNSKVDLARSPFRGKRNRHTLACYFRLKGRLIHKYCTFYLMSCPTGEAQPEETEGITECLWVPMDQAVEKIAYDNARTILVEAVEVIRGDPGLPFEI